MNKKNDSEFGIHFYNFGLKETGPPYGLIILSGLPFEKSQIEIRPGGEIDPPYPIAFYHLEEYLGNSNIADYKLWDDYPQKTLRDNRCK